MSASLSEALGIDPRTLRRWRKLPGAPAGDSLSAWQRFTADNDLGRPASGAMAAARLAKLTAEAGLAKLKLREARGEVVSREFVGERLRTNTLKFHQLMRFHLEQSLPPRLMGKGIAEIRKELKDAVIHLGDEWNRYLGVDEVTPPKPDADDGEDEEDEV